MQSLTNHLGVAAEGNPNVEALGNYRHVPPGRRFGQGRA